MPTPPRPPGRVSRRDQLLDAAAAIATKQGIQHLTIDAVALAANITKAGLIYHFKTRDDLLTALVERMLRDLDVLSPAPEAAPATAPTLKSVMNQMARETFEMPSEQRQLISNLLAAVSSHPQLIGPAQALYSRSYDWLAQSGEQQGQALLLAAALDGILLVELLNLYQFSPQQREAMRAALDSAIRALP